MFKKLFLILCILTICVTVSSGRITDKLKTVVAKKSEAAAGCDDCSGDLKFAWHMEDTTVTSGTPCGCVDSGDTTFDTDLSSGTQVYDGSNSVLIDAQETTCIDISSNDHIDLTESKLVFYFRQTVHADFSTLLRATGTGGIEEIICLLKENGVGASGHTDVGCNYRDEAGAGGNHTAWADIDYDEASPEWLKVVFEYHLTQNSIRVEVCPDDNKDGTCDSAADVGTNSDTLDAWSGSLTTLCVGNTSGTSPTYHIDNIKIYADTSLD
jgi:hypothetical protein